MFILASYFLREQHDIALHLHISVSPLQEGLVHIDGGVGDVPVDTHSRVVPDRVCVHRFLVIVSVEERDIDLGFNSWRFGKGIEGVA